MHRIDRRRRRDDGFTLVEILVVIIILGILAAIAIPIFLSQRGQAKNASENSDLRSVAGKMTIYNVDNPSYVGVPFGTGTGAGQTISGNSQIVGADTITLSPNNSVKLEAVGPGGFCLSAISVGNTAPLYYDSSGGGLTKASCTSKTYP